MKNKITKTLVYLRLVILLSLNDVLFCLIMIQSLVSFSVTKGYSV